MGSKLFDQEPKTVCQPSCIGLCFDHVVAPDTDRFDQGASIGIK